MKINRFKTAGNKLYFYFEEVKALKDGGVWYFTGFGIVLLLSIPVLIFELFVLLLTGKDFGLFQSMEDIEEEIILDANEVPENLRDLIPLAERWGIGDDAERGEVMESATHQELVDLEEKVSPKMIEIWEWLSGYSDVHYSDTTSYFTYLMVACDEVDIYLENCD